MQQTEVSEPKLISDWMPFDQLVPHIKLGDLLEIVPKFVKIFGNIWVIAVELEPTDCFVVNFNDGGAVRRDRLSKIALDNVMLSPNNCRINNSHDLQYPPFHHNEIVKRALSKVGMTLNAFQNSEHFVKECRNGDAGWMPYNQLLSYIKPGDLIEIKRTNIGYEGYKQFSICHWAVAVEIDSDECYVVNLTDDSKVHRECLSHITFGKKCRINNSFDQERPPFTAEEAVKRAIGKVGQSEKPYSLNENNCEHFAKEIRNGVSVSHQVLYSKNVMPYVNWVNPILSFSSSAAQKVSGTGSSRWY